MGVFMVARRLWPVRAVSFKLNRLKQLSQFQPFAPMDHLDEADAALQVRAKIREPLPVLRSGAETQAVGKCRFQYFQVDPAKIRLLIYDNAGEILPHAAAHDSGLVMVHG